MATARAARPSTGNRRDFNQMERVRLRPARMFEQGTSQAEVAHRPPHGRTPTAGIAAGNKAAAPPSAPPGGQDGGPSWTAEPAAGSSGP
jgi:hypothetical protein